MYLEKKHKVQLAAVETESLVKKETIRGRQYHRRHQVLQTQMDGIRSDSEIDVDDPLYYIPVS